MAIPGQNFTILDPGLGVTPAAINTPLFVGCCSAGAANTLYTFSRISDVIATLGQGPLAEAVCTYLANAGGPVFAIKLTGTRGGAGTVKKNAENAQQANQFTGNTRGVADKSGEVVAQAVNAMARIEESSSNISEIIGVIDEIARQTNLLALNAAVEAARAGEAGRGFAVVAQEVRSLAQRCSQAAKDIKDLIVGSSGQVKEGAELVNRAGASLGEIVESIKRVADIVNDITTGSEEQAVGIEQVNKALAQMDEVTQQNSALVEQGAAASQSLQQQTKRLVEAVSVFR